MLSTTVCVLCLFLRIHSFVCVSRLVWLLIWSCSSLTKQRHILRQVLHFTIMFFFTSFLNHPKYLMDDKVNRYGLDEALSLATALSVLAPYHQCHIGIQTPALAKPARRNSRTGAVVMMLSPRALWTTQTYSCQNQPFVYCELASHSESSLHIRLQGNTTYLLKSVGNSIHGPL